MKQIIFVKVGDAFFGALAWVMELSPSTKGFVATIAWLLGICAIITYQSPLGDHGWGYLVAAIVIIVIAIAFTLAFMAETASESKQNKP